MGQTMTTYFSFKTQIDNVYYSVMLEVCEYDFCCQEIEDGWLRSWLNGHERASVRSPLGQIVEVAEENRWLPTESA